MGIAEFIIPSELNQDTASGLAMRIGISTIKLLFNGNPDNGSQIETAGLMSGIIGTNPGSYQFGFEIWKGQCHLVDVYLRAKGNASEVSVRDARNRHPQITQDKADAILQEYLKYNNC